MIQSISVQEALVGAFFLTIVFNFLNLPKWTRKFVSIAMGMVIGFLI